MKKPIKFLISITSFLIILLSFTIVSSAKENYDNKIIENREVVAICNNKVFYNLDDAVAEYKSSLDLSQGASPVTLCTDIDYEYIIDSEVVFNLNGHKLNSNSYTHYCEETLDENQNVIRTYTYFDAWYDIDHITNVTWVGPDATYPETAYPWGSKIRVEPIMNASPLFYEENGVKYVYQGFSEYEGGPLVDKDFIAGIDLPDITLYPQYKPVEELFEATYLNIDEDFNFVYIVDKQNLVNPSIRFAIENEIYTVTDYVERNGKLYFRFESIDPRYFGDNIEAVLFDGDKSIKTFLNISIKDYCLKLLDEYKGNIKLTTLVYDILNLGAKTQIYKNYKVDKLITAGLQITERPVDIQQKIPALNQNDKKICNILGSCIHIDGEISLVFKVYASNFENLNIKTKAENNNISSELGYTSEKLSDYIYLIKTDPINAFDFYAEVNLELSTKEGQLVSSIKYSVDNYLSDMIGEENDPELIELLKAIKRYGESAMLYHNTIIF